MKKILRAIIIISCCFYIAHNSQLIAQQENLKDEKDSVSLQIDYLKQKREQSASRVRQINSKISTKEKQINELNAKILEQKEKVKDFENQVVLLKQDAKTQQTQLSQSLNTYRARLVQLHKIRQSTLFSSILSAENLNSFLNRFQMVKYLLESDKELIFELRQSLQKHKNIYEKLKSKQQKLKNSSQSLSESQKKLKREKSAYTSMLKTVDLENKLLSNREKKLAKQFEEIEKQIKEIEQAQNLQRIEGQLAPQNASAIETAPTLSDSAPKAAQVMNFLWPLHIDKIESHRQINESANASLLINSNSTAEVFASASGKVIYRGLIGGLGNVIILAHIRGFSTVYASLDEMWVGLGEIVERGQTIGMKKKNSSAVHFEVRFGGQRQPPLAMLPEIK